MAGCGRGRLRTIPPDHREAICRCGSECAAQHRSATLRPAQGGRVRHHGKRLGIAQTLAGAGHGHVGVHGVQRSNCIVDAYDDADLRHHGAACRLRSMGSVQRTTDQGRAGRKTIYHVLAGLVLGLRPFHRQVCISGGPSQTTGHARDGCHCQEEERTGRQRTVNHDPNVQGNQHGERDKDHQGTGLPGPAQERGSPRCVHAQRQAGRIAGLKACGPAHPRGICTFTNVPHAHRDEEHENQNEPHGKVQAKEGNREPIICRLIRDGEEKVQDEQQEERATRNHHTERATRYAWGALGRDRQGHLVVWGDGLSNIRRRRHWTWIPLVHWT